MKIKYKVMVNVTCPKDTTARDIEDEISSWLQDLYKGECTSIVLEGERIEEREELEVLDPNRVYEEVYDTLADYFDDAVVDYAERHGYEVKDVFDKLAQATPKKETNG